MLGIRTRSGFCRPSKIETLATSISSSRKHSSKLRRHGVDDFRMDIAIVRVKPIDQRLGIQIGHGSDSELCRRHRMSLPCINPSAAGEEKEEDADPAVQSKEGEIDARQVVRFDDGLLVNQEAGDDGGANEIDRSQPGQMSNDEKQHDRARMEKTGDVQRGASADGLRNGTQAPRACRTHRPEARK